MAGVSPGGARTPLTYPGWRAVLAGFLVLFFAFGAPTATMPLVYGEVMREFGWTRTEATLVYTYKDITSAIIALFFVGPALARFGLKRVMVASLIATGAGMAVFFLIDSLWLYYLSGFIKGLGQTTVLICAKILVARWFMRNVGLAVGVAVIGTSIGGVVFPVLCAWMIEEWGWRVAFGALSFGVFAVAMPAFLLLAKDNPSNEDILPEVSLGKAGPASAAQLESAHTLNDFAGILRTPMFWCVTIGIVLIAGVDQGLYQHTMLYLTEHAGLTTQIAAAALSVTFALSIISKFVAGRFFDRYSIKGIALWYVLVALVVLLAFPVQGLVTALIFTCARGIAHGGLISESPVIAKHCYGPRFMDKVMPILSGCWTIGSAMGPVGLSLLYDNTGGYALGFALFVAIALVAAATLALFVKPLYRDRLRALQATSDASRTSPVSESVQGVRP